MTGLVHEAASTREERTVFDRPAGEVELRELAAMATAVVRASTTVAGLKAEIGDALHEVELLTARAAVNVVGPPFVRYLDWSEGHLVAEIGFPVARPMQVAGRVEPSELPSGRVATVVHVGRYETIATTYALMTARLEELGLHATGPMWEVYWSDPQRQPDPATWRTEIVYPVG